MPENQLGLVNHSILLPFRPQKGQLYSVGLHPWDLDAIKGTSWLLQLEQLLQHPQVMAIGECGIDRHLETAVDQQTELFLAQAELAEKHSKPMILHAVRSYADLLQLKKQRADAPPWILHGYQGNKQTTEQLVRYNFHFAIGAALLKNQEKLNRSLAAIPRRQLFFETDESSVNIESIYIFAAKLLNIPLPTLCKQVFNNYQQIFER